MCTRIWPIRPHNGVSRWWLPMFARTRRLLSCTRAVIGRHAQDITDSFAKELSEILDSTRSVRHLNLPAVASVALRPLCKSVIETSNWKLSLNATLTAFMANTHVTACSSQTQFATFKEKSTVSPPPGTSSCACMQAHEQMHAYTSLFPWRLPMLLHEL